MGDAVAEADFGTRVTPQAVAGASTNSDTFEPLSGSAPNIAPALPAHARILPRLRRFGRRT